MTGPERAKGNNNFIGELLAAWVVVLSAFAIALLLFAFHGSLPDDRAAPGWHARPIVEAEEADEDLSAPRSADWVVRQSTGSSAPAK
jgi:hypothetical protein